MSTTLPCPEGECGAGAPGGGEGGASNQGSSGGGETRDQNGQDASSSGIGSGGRDLGDAGSGNASAGMAGAATDDGCRTELLVERGFDMLGAWQESAVPSGFMLVMSDVAASELLGFELEALSAPNLLWLGGIAGDTQSAYQTVAIPETTKTLVLRGVLRIGTELATAANGDRVAIGFIDAFGAGVELIAFSPLDEVDTWQPFEASIAGIDMAGSSLNFGIGAVTDGFANTNFFFDSVSLEANVCD